MTPGRKLRMSAVLFALALVMVAVAAATQAVAPLFVAWVPLGFVPWVLTRPGPDWEPSEGSPTTVGEAPAPASDDSSAGNDEAGA